MIEAPANFLTANAALAKHPIYLIEIEGYTRAFTNYDTGVTGQYDWIESIDDLSTTISDLDGSADLGEFSFTLQDKSRLLTGDFPGFVFEGKQITLKTGFVGMLQSDFALLFTGQIDTVASANSNNSYLFTCVDNKQALTKVIFTVGDDGAPTDSDHPRTLNGHPLDIMIAALRNEVGMPDRQINTGKIQLYRDVIFSGVQFTFSIDSPPAAKDFIEQQILKPLGGYMWSNNLGQIDVNFFYPEPPSVLITVDGACGPWFYTPGDPLNATYGYFSHGAAAPAMVPVLPGDMVVLNRVAGLISIDPNTFGYFDGLGDPATNGNDPNGQPGFYVAATTHHGSCLGAWVDAIGAIVAQPFLIGNGGTFTAPAGAKQLHVGINTAGFPAYGYFTFTVIAPFHPITPYVLNDDNLIEIPEAKQADLINTTSFRFDKNSDGKFMAESIQSYDVSVAKYGQFGQDVIESDGMRSGFQGFFLATLISRLIFYRYGLKNLLFDDVPAIWSAALLEPGDPVYVTSAFVPDRETGVMGVTAKLFEVLDRTWNFTDGQIHLKLIDASYRLKFGQYLITPNAEADFTAASSGDKAKYMFLCNNSDQYSDTTPGHILG